ncbi:MAG: DinB family protein [Chloroflexi bacterium]|nr:DinB family protein [Chloroflexota bacterium]
MLSLTSAIARLSANAEAFAALTRSVSDEQARWKPSAEEWSVLEVVCHLHDEEREDFRQRVDLTLHSPATDWPPIDPMGWVTARGYNQRELAPMLDSFLSERRKSVEWLSGLKEPDWSMARRHPVAGTMTAGDVLGAWVAHDHLHIRQLNHLHWQYLAAQVDPVSTDYAGGW